MTLILTIWWILILNCLQKGVFSSRSSFSVLQKTSIWKKCKFLSNASRWKNRNIHKSTENTSDLDIGPFPLFKNYLFAKNRRWTRKKLKKHEKSQKKGRKKSTFSWSLAMLKFLSNASRWKTAIYKYFAFLDEKFSRRNAVEKFSRRRAVEKTEKRVNFSRRIAVENKSSRRRGMKK